MKLFFGLNPSQNQINDYNLKQGKPREWQPRDEGDPMRRPPADAQQHPRQETRCPDAPHTACQTGRNTVSSSAAPAPPPFRPTPKREVKFVPNTFAQPSAPQAVAQADQPGDITLAAVAQPAAALPDTPLSAQPAAAPQTFQAPPPQDDHCSPSNDAPAAACNTEKPDGQAAVKAEIKQPARQSQAEDSDTAELDRLRRELEELKAKLTSPTDETQENTPAERHEFIADKAAEAPRNEIYAEQPPPLPTRTETQNGNCDGPKFPMPFTSDAEKKPAQALELKSTTGNSMLVREDCSINFFNAKQLNRNDFQYLDHTEQFRLWNGGGQWFISPGKNTKNSTMLDFRLLLCDTPLKEGARISISMPGITVHKMILTVHFL